MLNDQASTTPNGGEWLELRLLCCLTIHTRAKMAPILVRAADLAYEGLAVSIGTAHEQTRQLGSEIFGIQSYHNLAATEFSSWRYCVYGSL